LARRIQRTKQFTAAHDRALGFGLAEQGASGGCGDIDHNFIGFDVGHFFA
jgi:hypothetical protein